MEICIPYAELVKRTKSKTHFCSLNSASANNSVAAHNPLGHVVVYAPSHFRELHLVLHHI